MLRNSGSWLTLNRPRFFVTQYTKALSRKELPRSVFWIIAISTNLQVLPADHDTFDHGPFVTGE
jgi:hypothetical protein